MRFRTRHSPLLLLAAASVVSALADVAADSKAAPLDAITGEVAHSDAAVDGKDGVAHTGPHVPVDGATEPAQPVVVSDHDKSDVAAADKAEPAQPKSPEKEPVLPHSEEEKMKLSGQAGGLDDTQVPEITEVTKDDAYEVIDSDSDDEHPGLSQPPKEKEDKTTKLVVEEDEGLIQPFHSFVLSFTMILFSEVGDKTFLVAALMAMKHDRMVVFTAAFGALAVMTVLSALLGQVAPHLLSKHLTSLAAAILFFVFGGKMLHEGMQMDPNEGVTAEMHEVEQELAEKEKEMGKRAPLSADALEMGMGGRASRSKSRFASPPRSPSQSPTRGPENTTETLKNLLAGATNLASLLLSPAWAQTFVMTFLGEWGDRSQIATIAMSAGDDYWWVALGSLVGHSICTGAAVIGGRAIAGRVSLKVVTVGGAVAFLVFGVIYFFEAIYG